jgi:hypothetical protein
MEAMGPVTFGGFDSPLNETSEKHIPIITRQRYQRKVRVTYTRAEAELLRRLILRLSTDKELASLFEEPGVSTKTLMYRVKNIWRKTDRQIGKRDDRQRAKESVDQPDHDDLPIDEDRDVPLF